MTETEAALVEAVAVATAARTREARLWTQIRLLRGAILLLLVALIGVSVGFVWQREVARTALQELQTRTQADEAALRETQRASDTARVQRTHFRLGTEF